jgi:hypothetical protein
VPTPEPAAPRDFGSLLSAPPEPAEPTQAASQEPVAAEPATPEHWSPPTPAFTPAPTFSAAPVTDAPVTDAPSEAVDAAAPTAGAPASIPLMPDPAWGPPSAPAPSVPAVPASEAPTTTSQPPVGERPRNHWSRQAELDDEAQPPTGSLSRDVGVGSATANALVLPEVPNADLIMGTVGSTGESIITGTISLPASLASTGALPAQLDESDLDNLLDVGDQQVVSTDSQPVRAMRAVSTHTSSREIIGNIKPKRSNRALTVLIVAAAGMAVVVVTLLVVALTQGVLN